MWLGYESIPIERPSKVGLVVLGALLCVPAGLLCLAAPFFLLVMLTGAMGKTVGLIVVPIAGMYLVAGGLLGWLAIDIIRARRWTRPFVLAFSAFTAIGAFAAAPSFFLLFSQSPPGPTQLVGFIVGISLTFLLMMGVPATLFLYFARTATREILEIYQPAPSWTDQWSVPVFSVGAISALLAILAALGVVFSAGLLMSSPSIGVLLNLCWQVVGMFWLSLIAILCFRHRYRKAWFFAIAYVTCAAIAGIVFTLALPDVALRSAGVFTRQPSASTPSSVAILQGLITWAAYAGVLFFFRSRFLSVPPDEAQISAPPPSPLPHF